MPTGRIPTDINSLISIAAVIGVILGAVVLGVFLSSLNPTDPLVGEGGPTPTATPSPSAEPTAAPPSETPAPTPSPTPALPGTIAFGDSLDANPNGRQIRSRRSRRQPRSRTPSRCRAGSAPIRSRTRSRRSPMTGPRRSCFPRQGVPVDPAATSFGYVVGTAGDFLGRWGPGEFEWRVYVDGSRRGARPVPVLRGLASRQYRRHRPRHRRRGERGRAGSRGTCAEHRSRWWHRG